MADAADSDLTLRFHEPQRHTCNLSAQATLVSMMHPLWGVRTIAWQKFIVSYASVGLRCGGNRVQTIGSAQAVEEASSHMSWIQNQISQHLSLLTIWHHWTAADDKWPNPGLPGRSQDTP